MAILTMPAAPRFQDFSFHPVANVVSHRSPLSKHGEEVVFPGTRWMLKATLPPMKEDEGGEEWAAFFAKLQGPAGRFYAGDGRRVIPRGLGTTIAARANDVQNNVMAGAVVGALPSPGALPTGWVNNFNSGGWSIDVVGVGQEGDIDYIDLRFHSPTMVGQTNVDFTGTGEGRINVALNDVRTASFYCTLQAGSLAGNVRVKLAHSFYDSGHGYITSNSSGPFSVGAGALAAGRYSWVDTVNDPLAAKMSLIFVVLADVATTPDVTLRIGWPQDEPSATLSAPLVVNGAARSAPAGPFVEFGGQTGSAMNLGGFDPGVSGLLRVGDYFAYTVPNGRRTLHKVTADPAASGTDGVLAVEMTPPIKESPADLAAVSIAPAQAVMQLVDTGQGEVQVDRAGFYRVSFQAVEARI